MNYVVLFQRGDRTPNIDSWHVTEEDAEKRVEELKGQFDWVNINQKNDPKSVKVWCVSA